MIFATFVSLSVVKQSMLPRLRFDIDLQNNDQSQICLVYGWTGELYLQEPEYLRIGDLATEFNFMSLNAGASNRIRTYCEISYDKLEIIEDLRKGANLGIGIHLQFISALMPKAATPQIQGDSLWVKPSTGEDIILIQRSLWDDTLEELNYSTVVTLRLPFPPPPIGTQLDKSIEYLKNAQKKINDGEWPDSIGSCRKAIEELQNLIGYNEEERKVFFQSILKDKKKAKECEGLWEAIRKAKHFAGGGGSHIYWVKMADKRDAELAIRVVSAFVHYFAHNLARASASMKRHPEGTRRRRS